jgi:hypothetical protein
MIIVRYKIKRKEKNTCTVVRTKELIVLSFTRKVCCIIILACIILACIIYREATCHASCSLRHRVHVSPVTTHCNPIRTVLVFYFVILIKFIMMIVLLRSSVLFDIATATIAISAHSYSREEKSYRLGRCLKHKNSFNETMKRRMKIKIWIRLLVHLRMMN